jgi:hypothetical protein
VAGVREGDAGGRGSMRQHTGTRTMATHERLCGLTGQASAVES